jgi:serine/threonine-protein kinase
LAPNDARSGKHHGELSSCSVRSMLIEQLGPYRIVRKVGRGGMGTVYEAVNVQTNETAAVKLLNPHLADEEGFRERFGTEIETLKKLKHPNIVRLFGYGIQDGHPYYAMELVPGINLEDELQAGRRFDWRETTRIAIKLCRALKHAHDHGVIHRDIKPANLLLTPEGDVKLTDFGIARLFGNTRLTSEGGLIGTAEYMSPEQAAGRPVSLHADLYSLGCVMFAMLAGRPPFRSKSLPEMLQMQRNDDPPPVSRYARDVPLELERIIARLLSKNGSERGANAGLLGRQLAAMEHGLSMSQHGGTGAAGSESAGSFSSFASAKTFPDQSGQMPLEYDPNAPTRVAEPGESEAASRELVRSNETAVSEPPVLAADDAARGNASAGVATRPAEPAVNNLFVTVEEEERQLELARRQNRGPVVAQIALLLASLVTLIVIAMYLMQPPSADVLYGRVEAMASDEDPDRLLDAADDIDRFLQRFPDDPRARLLRKHQEEIELLRLERKFARRSRQLTRDPDLLPIERDYIEAINQIGVDPERTASELKALVTVYGAAEPTEERSIQALEVARRQLARLDQQAREQAPAYQAAIARSMRQAETLRDEQPEAAQGIWRSIVTLYHDKPWAVDLVRKAEAELERLAQPSP